MSSARIKLNCVVFGRNPSEVFTIKISSTEDVSALRELIVEKIETRFKANMLRLYQLDLPWHNTLLLREFKDNILAAMPLLNLQSNHTLDTIFPSSPNASNLHIVILRPDITQEAIVGSLERQCGALFGRLQMEVSKFGVWTGSDVVNNLNGGGIIASGCNRPDECGKIVEIEDTLAQPRPYIRSNPESQEPRRARKYYGDLFSSVFEEIIPMNVDSPSASVVADSPSSASNREFATFLSIMQYGSGDLAHIKADLSSALKAQHFGVHFMLPPFYSPSSNPFQYRVKTSWAFPIFLTRVDRQRLYCKYTPRPNIMVQSASLLPLISSEVVSGPHETDRIQMQIQLIALARAGQYLIDDNEQFFSVGVYLTKDLVAERYIVSQIPSSQKVFMCQTDFKLDDPKEAVLYLREMYNLAPKLEEWAGKFKSGKDRLLQIQTASQGLLSLTAMSQQLGGPSAGTLPTAAEREDSDVAGDMHDGLGVFGASDIQHILKEMNYEIEFIPFGHPFVAMVSSVTDPSKMGFLKFVKEGHNEIPILQYLSKINSPRNHTISGVQFWPVRGGQVISMPEAGCWLTDLENLDAQLWSVAGQLIEAIDFMHQHGVAHLDLKPGNILIPRNGGHLSVIDFHTSVRIKGVNTMFRSAAGTHGYMAPEVAADRGLYSAIRADLWSCGKILDDLCDLCQPSVDRDKLLQLARELMDEDPKKRPMMTEVLKRMADDKASGSQGVGVGNIVGPTICPGWVPPAVPDSSFSKSDLPL